MNSVLESLNFSLDSLEFDRLKSLLGRYISTSCARALLRDVAPSMDLDRLEAAHALTAEAMAYLREERVAFAEVPALEEAVGKLGVEGALMELPEIEAVQALLGQIEALRTRWKEDAEAFPRLTQEAARLPDLRELSKQLARAVHDGEIDEKYSPDLARIRRSLESTRARITDRLESMLRSPDYASQIQDQLVTVRNGRFVIPVRIEHRRSVDGVVHGTSSSGATVFMEPLGVLDLNNELVRLQEEEHREIARILAELTGLIQAEAARLLDGRMLAGELELTFAKARFGREFDCTQPVFSSRAPLSLIRARHPLLEDNLRREGRHVSPFSLDLDSTRRILVISGPNAGGKTVVLKTVGLLSLMAQSGIPVPAEEATLPVFDRILADIGDQQSIANHLSTFSAHVLTIKSMIESATARSLVLLDEIGGSTEPGEGAALARAVLERFRRAGLFAIATTHYNRLKIYAETTPEVANAAMEFNERTLEPTFRLLHGLAGASSGLKIAERLAMPPDVLQDAWSSLDAGETETARYVDELRRRMADLETESSKLAAERREFEAWREREIARLDASRQEEFARLERRLAEIAREMSDRAARELAAIEDETLKKKYQRKIDQVKARAAAQLREEQHRLGGRSPRPAEAPAEGEVRIGANVRVRSIGVTGAVVSLAEGEAEVVAGNIRMRRPVSDLEALEQEVRPLPGGVQVHAAEKELGTNEINLLGCTVDEALSRTDKFLDEAFLAQIPQVRIVHGSGTGALRNAVSELLRRHPHVARFEFAPQAQGGRGVTIVTLRD